MYRYPLEDIYFTEEDIENILNEVEPNLSCGPDGLPGILIRKCSHALSFPLTLLWRKSLKEGKVPVMQKRSIVVPGLKPGCDRTDPASFRPLSMTSHLIKCFERLLKPFIQSHLETNELITSLQHGFIQNKSCLTQLLIFNEKISKLVVIAESFKVFFGTFCENIS